MTKRETVNERRIREANEAREAELRFQSEKHRRMLIAIARAQELGFQVKLETHSKIPTDVIVEIIDRDCILYCDSWFNTSIMEEWKLNQLEDDLTRITNERNAERERLQRRQELLNRLTPEERDLLGV